MQNAEERQEQFLELDEKVTTWTLRDFSPAGVKGEINYEGRVSGAYNAKRMETVSFVLKPDGTGEYETRKLDITDDGEVVLVTGKGRGRLETGTQAVWEGEDTFRTASKKLAWLNSTRARTVGTQNMTTGEASVKFYRKT